MAGRSRTHAPAWMLRAGATGAALAALTLLGGSCASGATGSSAPASQARGTPPPLTQEAAVGRSARSVTGSAAAAACTGAPPAGGQAPARPRVALTETSPVMFRLNQVGYVSGCPKQAWVMVRRAVHSRRFSVLSPGGATVARGSASGPVRWNARYLVYGLNLSALRRPGSYTLSFDGSRSSALRVGDALALYRPLADAALAFLQSQRDGGQVIAGPMHRRPAHLDDASAPVYAIPRYRGSTLTGRLTPTGTRVDVSGGWFDAGDYLKFVETASFTDIGLLLTARDQSSSVSSPTALLGEARFGTDWLMKMWSQSRRVLYFQVGIGDGNGSSILGDHDLWRLPQADARSAPRLSDPAHLASHRPVFAANAPGAPISPNLAGRTAAAFGLCAQVFAHSDPAYALRCLLDGQTIYDRANTRPTGALVTSVPHAYYTETEWRDDLELGATELYLGTAALGTSAAGLPHPLADYYLTPAGRWANAYIVAHGSGSDSLNLYDVSTIADLDLVRILQTRYAQNAIARELGVNVATDVPSLRKDRHDQLALAARLSRRDPFGLADPATPLDTVAHALGYAVQARMYHATSGSAAFDSLGQTELDWVLGGNAWGSSFIVGAGSVFPHCLASQIPNLSGSLNGRGAILTGAPVDGPTSPVELQGLGAPSGYRPCPARPATDPFALQRGRGLAYLDDVRASASSEPTDDLAALALLAAAGQAQPG